MLTNRSREHLTSARSHVNGDLLFQLNDNLYHSHTSLLKNGKTKEISHSVIGILCVFIARYG